MVNILEHSESKALRSVRTASGDVQSETKGHCLYTIWQGAPLSWLWSAVGVSDLSASAVKIRPMPAMYMSLAVNIACLQTPIMTHTTNSSLADFPDILHCVFAFLDPDLHLERKDVVYESRQALAASARTCSGFTGPALSVLWKRLPDDQPLADLLCALDIAEMDKLRQDLGRNKAGRYDLPNQDKGGYRLSGAAEEYEERWRLSRGYDVKYVRPPRWYSASLHLTSFFF